MYGYFSLQTSRGRSGAVQSVTNSGHTLHAYLASLNKVVANLAQKKQPEGRFFPNRWLVCVTEGQTIGRGSPKRTHSSDARKATSDTYSCNLQLLLYGNTNQQKTISEFQIRRTPCQNSSKASLFALRISPRLKRAIPKCEALKPQFCPNIFSLYPALLLAFALIWATALFNLLQALDLTHRSRK